MSYSDMGNNENMLNKRVVISLIADFMKENNFQYGLSVFLPESGFSDNLLTKIELSQLLGLNNIEVKKKSDYKLLK